MRAYCAQLGMEFREQDVPDADQQFEEAGLTQEQAEVCFRIHAHRIKYFFTPSTYVWKHRFLLALHFLFGRS